MKKRNYEIRTLKQELTDKERALFESENRLYTIENSMVCYISNLYSQPCLKDWFGLCFKATFKYISVILWQSIVLVEETKVYRENH